MQSGGINKWYKFVLDILPWSLQEVRTIAQQEEIDQQIYRNVMTNLFFS